jgi:hypothetical protein
MGFFSYPTHYASPVPPGPAGPAGPAHILTLADLNALILTLPTSLPATAGILWNNGGEVAIS